MSALRAPITGFDLDQGREERPSVVETEARPRLRAVPRPLPRLARVPFLLVLIAIFGLGMTGLLMLNTTLQNQAFQASTLNRRAAELAYTQADLETRLDQSAAPQELARRASAYGLRPNPYPVFLVLPSGKVVGKPKPVAGNEVPFLVIKTPEELAAERAAEAIRARQLAALRVARAKAAAQAATARAKAAKAATKPATSKPATSKPAARKPATSGSPAKKSAGGPVAKKKTGGRG